MSVRKKRNHELLTLAKDLDAVAHPKAQAVAAELRRIETRGPGRDWGSTENRALKKLKARMVQRTIRNGVFPAELYPPNLRRGR